MNYYYAQINTDNICFAVSDLSGEVRADNMIRLENYDASLLGKRYVDGKWLEVEPRDESA